MGGGNLQKSQMARERNRAKMEKEAAGGGGAAGMKSRQADASVHAAAQEARKAKEADRAERERLKKEKEEAVERKAAKASKTASGATGGELAGKGGDKEKKALAAAALAAAMNGGKPPAPKKKKEEKKQDEEEDKEEKVEVAEDAVAVADTNEDAAEATGDNDPMDAEAPAEEEAAGEAAIPQRVYTAEEIEKQQQMKREAEAAFAKRIANTVAQEKADQVAQKSSVIKAAIGKGKGKAGVTADEFDVLLAASGLA